MVQPTTRRVNAYFPAPPVALHILRPYNSSWNEARHDREHASTWPRNAHDKSHAKDVLIVEDETYLCELVADVLEAEGHRTRTAANGLDALERVKESKPQIILLDLMMPVMDGWEFIRALRANPEWKEIPIVVVTAVYDIKRTQQETGAVAVVTKPFDIEQIAEVVSRYSS
jgi:two-component system, chemotaxis family, chemotaxis protein CheY